MLQDYDRIDIDELADGNQSPTLICDYSENNLNQLFMKSKAMALEVGDYSYAGHHTELNSQQHSSPGKSSGPGDTYNNQLTKLDDEEENVDFIQMFNQYQMQQRAQVQYYQPANDIQSERMNQSYQGVVHQAPLTATKRSKKSGMRPNSASVAQPGRFLSNQQSKRKVPQSGQQKLDQVSYSYQQPAHTQSNKAISTAQFATQRNSNMQAVPGRPPMPGGRIKKVRPQSAARNQMQPAKELQSVTNFTYQKAKQNLNQKSYVPDSLKNTDKERLYEEKINLKKELNDLSRENQQLKTQILSQQVLVRKKDEMVQQVMKQVFHPSAKEDNFLQEFQSREIQHAVIKKVAQKQGAIVSKESANTNLKMKVKEINEMYNQKEKELQDLKQTLKFTKIKEYESELALNVQESQRLRMLLEREIQKPKVDPRYMQSLKQQNSHYQQIIQNLQQNQQIQQENQEKLNKKLVSKIKQFSKLKEARKKLNEKNHRLEKKMASMGNKINSQGLENQQIKAQSRRAQQPVNQQAKQWEKRFNQQNSIIEKLLIKMSEYGIEISEQSLMDMQNQIEEEEEEVRSSTMDLIVTFGPQLDQEATTKQMMGARFESLAHLKQTLQKEFGIVDVFTIKYVTEEGDLIELTASNWEKMKILSETNQIQLAVELTNGIVDEEPSNYEEDDFEETDSKVVKDPVTLAKVQKHFDELLIILKVKQIKKGDSLKYILHGLRDENGKKFKTVTLEMLQNQLADKIGFTDEVSEKISRFLIEMPNTDGKIEFNIHASIRRKDLQAKLLSHLKDYMLYNSLAITSLLNRLQGIFEDYKSDLLQEIEDQDYDDLGTAPIEDIYKCMKLVGLYPDTWDEDIIEMIEFMAMRQSSGLDEIQYKDLMKVLDEDYSYLEDKKSIWESFGEDGEVASPYEPSSDEGELQSERQPIKQQQEGEEGSNVEDLEQNELLEKVDEILMQIVQRLPSSQKIKTLTQYLMPYLSPIFDQSQQRQYLIISQNAFIQFLLGQNPNQLGLQLEESHIICLLHLLVQEDESDQQDSTNKYILYDEFIELVKTYMKKELIMQQSKSLGINYDILSKESVEFLFQIRSSLMHDNNINENSADEEEEYNRQSPEKKKQQKSVPAHIREIFKAVIAAKNISLAKSKKGSTVEVMDFGQMLDILYVRLGIHSPGSKALEQLKFLMCLDFKYLEMVMLIKFDKIMHDLDYISIDLLRQAQDSSLNKLRKKMLDSLKKVREDQLSSLKRKPQPQIYGTSSQQIEYQGAGVTHSTKQEKKRKRPDDKKQGVSKKGGRQEVESSAVVILKTTSGYDQDHSGQKVQQSTDAKALEMEIDVEPESDIQDEGIEDLYEDEFDDDKARQMAIAAEIAVAENISDFEDDYLQDDIPIDEDEDEDDGIISDNYENFTKDVPVNKKNRPMTAGKTRSVENVISMEHSDDLMESQPDDMRIQDGNIQPDESQIEDSPDEMEERQAEIEESQAEMEDSQGEMEDSQAEIEDEDNYEDDEDEDIDDNYPDDDDEMDEMDDVLMEYNKQKNQIEDRFNQQENQIEDSQPIEASEDNFQEESQPMEDSQPKEESQQMEDSQPMEESQPMEDSQPLNQGSPNQIEESAPQSFENTEQDFNFRQNDKDSSIQVLRTFEHEQEPDDMSPPGMPKELAITDTKNYSSEKEAQDKPQNGLLGGHPESSVQIMDDEYIQDDDEFEAQDDQLDASIDVQQDANDKSLSKYGKSVALVSEQEYEDDDFGESSDKNNLEESSDNENLDDVESSDNGDLVDLSDKRSQVVKNPDFKKPQQPTQKPAEVKKEVQPQQQDELSDDDYEF